MRGLNVLSLFDGMSCGQIALREAGIEVNKYFASEIDKHAIAQTQHNFPDTMQLGSVTEVHAADLPPIDLLIGGSPCQGFSFAGKQLNFNDPRSVLFFEYVRLLKEIQEYNPGVLFLLENVRMKREYAEVINSHLGLEPVMINSNRVSAQNRVRLYWTNIRTRAKDLFTTITDIPQPTDKGLLIADILDEGEIPEKYFLSDKVLANLQRHKERQKAMGNGFGVDIRQPTDKAAALTVGGRSFRDLIDVSIIQRPHGFNEGGVFTEKAPTLTANSWEHNNHLRITPKREVRQLNPSKESGGKQPYQQNRVYDVNGISPALMNGSGQQTCNVLIGGVLEDLHRRSAQGFKLYPIGTSGFAAKRRFTRCSVTVGRWK